MFILGLLRRLKHRAGMRITFNKETLKHIDIDVHPGETHVLFGPNTSGKTSLLMTIRD